MVDEYKDEQYEVDQNHVLQLMKLEQIKQNTYSVLKESDLINIINENIDEIKENGLEFEDILIISKSRQILDFQLKSQDALMIQSFVRSILQQNQYKKIKLHKKQHKNKDEQLLTENIRLTQEFNAKQKENMSQSQIIDDQQRQIQKLQEMIKQLREEKASSASSNSESNSLLNEQINTFKQENDALKRENSKQKDIISKHKEEIMKLREEHLMDKQKFAMTMMDEMNNLREQIKIIGKQQLIYQQQLREKQQSQQEEQQQSQQNGTYFGRFW